MQRTVTNKNITELVKLNVEINCQQCGNGFETKINGTEKRRSHICNHCSSDNQNIQVLKGIEGIISSISGYSVKNCKNRSLYIDNGEYGFMFWSTGTVSVTGTISNQEATDITNDIFTKIDSNFQILETELTNVEIKYELPNSIDLYGFYDIVKNESLFDEITMVDESYKSLYNLELKHGRNKLEVFTSGKILVHSKSIEEAEESCITLKDYIESNYESLVETPSDSNGVDEMYIFNDRNNQSTIPDNEVQKLKEKL